MTYAGNGGGLEQTAGGSDRVEWWQAKPAGCGCGLDAGGEEREGSSLYNRVGDNTLLLAQNSEEDRDCGRRVRSV